MFRLSGRQLREARGFGLGIAIGAGLYYAYYRIHARITPATNDKENQRRVGLLIRLFLL